MNDFKKGSEPQYAAGKQVKKGADLTGGLVVGKVEDRRKMLITSSAN